MRAAVCSKLARVDQERWGTNHVGGSLRDSLATSRRDSATWLGYFRRMCMHCTSHPLPGYFPWILPILPPIPVVRPVARAMRSRSSWGGFLMKHPLLLTFVACLLSSGCQRALVGCKDCGQACHITRSQMAPRPKICRTTCRGDGKALSDRCNLGQGDDCEGCCDPCDQGCLDGCSELGGRLCGKMASARECLNPHAGGYPERGAFTPGPPIGQVAYPYYTVRSPRDFLQDNPPSIGPY